MHSSTKKCLTEQAPIQNQLDRLFFLAAQEKLLPKIIYDYSIQNKDPKLINEYRRSVKNIYSKETHIPLKYNPEEARTHREKFREKVLKLMHNELPIEYLKSIQMDGKRVMTYQGHPLEEVQYPAKKEYQIFNNFDETKFKKGTHQIFDDKLEYKHKNVISHVERGSLRKTNKNCVTEPSSHKKFLGNSQSTLQQTPAKEDKKNLPMSLPKLIARTQLERNRQSSPLSSVRTKKPTRMNHCNQRELLIDKMRVIGHYHPLTPADTLMITKESVIKFFKQFYPRPHRIIDFLEFSDVESLQSYSKIPQRLKLMPNQHICFMTFLFYDSNNDGYICDNDIFRISQMVAKCPLLQGDYNVLKKKGLKIEYSEDLPYKQLYKLPEVTQATYFNWTKKQEERMLTKTLNKIQKEIKGYFGYLNRKKIMINYEGFKKLMKGQKPFLWYDLLWRISGITYADAKYHK